MATLFERPDAKARKQLWKAGGGSAWKYIGSVLVVGFGVGGLLQAGEFVRRSHPLLTRILFGNPGLFFTMFGALFGLSAGVYALRIRGHSMK
jgi:hypothetical protein